MASDANFNPEKFAVIGAGPVGCILAAYLAKGGYDVTLCDIVPALIAPACDRGIVIEGVETLAQPITRTCQHVEDLAKVGPDAIFVTSKANALPLIASAIEGFFDEEMVVISWQNGIDTELAIAETLGKKGVMRAVVNYGCTLLSPCRVHIAFHHSPHFIQELDPGSKPAAVAVADALSHSGLATLHTDDIVSMVWQKAILNSSMNPVCAVTGLTMSEVMNDPIIFQTVSAMLKEAIRVARANEISLGWDFFPKAVEYLSKAGNHKPSMLMDISNNRKTEIDFINGKVIEYGAQANVPTPYNSTLRALIKGLESKQT